MRAVNFAENVFVSLCNISVVLSSSPVFDHLQPPPSQQAVSFALARHLPFWHCAGLISWLSQCLPTLLYQTPLPCAPVLLYHSTLLC
jgi:hypothetical protein